MSTAIFLLSHTLFLFQMSEIQVLLDRIIGQAAFVNLFLSRNQKLIVGDDFGMTSKKRNINIPIFFPEKRA